MQRLIGIVYVSTRIGYGAAVEESRKCITKDLYSVLGLYMYIQTRTYMLHRENVAPSGALVTVVGLSSHYGCKHGRQYHLVGPWCIFIFW